MKKRIIGLFLVLNLFVASPLCAGTIKEYSADMVDVKTNRVAQKIYIMEQKMRVDAYAGSATQPMSASILRMDQKKMYVLMPQAKTYFEMPLDDTVKSMDDIAKSLMPGGKVDVQREKQGTETISGYDTEKFKITTTVTIGSKSEVLISYDWQAPEFEPMPVRVEMPQTHSVLEMRTIKKGPSKPELFEVPAGYKRDNAMEKMMQQNRK